MVRLLDRFHGILLRRVLSFCLFSGVYDLQTPEVASDFTVPMQVRLARTWPHSRPRISPTREENMPCLSRALVEVSPTLSNRG